MNFWLKKYKNWFSNLPNPQDMLDMGEDLHENFLPWWGNYTAIEHKVFTINIGNIVIGIRRKFNEWQVSSWKKIDQNLGSESIIIDRFPDNVLTRKTIVYRSQQTQFSINPILGLRPLVSRLPNTLHIPAGTEILLYISTPVWIKISAASPNILLDQISTASISDTWLGLNTLEGELCHSSEIHCRTRLEYLKRNNHCVITPALIKNHSKSPLAFSIAHLPLPNLSIYSDKFHRLWTERLIFKREGEDIPYVKISRGPPELLQTPQLRCTPKGETEPSSGLIKIFK